MGPCPSSHPYEYDDGWSSPKCCDHAITRDYGYDYCPGDIMFRPYDYGYDDDDTSDLYPGKDWLTILYKKINSRLLYNKRSTWKFMTNGFFDICLEVMCLKNFWNSKFFKKPNILFTLKNIFKFFVSKFFHLKKFFEISFFFKKKDSLSFNNHLS